MKPDWFQHLPEEARAQAQADWNRMVSLESDLAKADAMKADVQSLTANVKLLTAKVAVLEELLRLRRLERYGRKNEKLSDEQLMLLIMEPSVSAQELAQEAALPAKDKELETSPAPPKRIRTTRAGNPFPHICPGWR